MTETKKISRSDEVRALEKKLSEYTHPGLKLTTGQVRAIKRRAARPQRSK